MRFHWAVIVACSGCFTPAFDGAPPCTVDSNCAHLQRCDLDYGVCRVADDEMRSFETTTFTMGCPENDADPECDSDEISHRVTLSAYSIDTHEVTQSAYAQCIAAGACTPPTAGFSPATERDRPVRDVTYEQAVAFCAWRGKRLPTEAEWEHACRDGDQRVWPWGNEVPTCARANMTMCDGTIAPIGSRPEGASAALVFDLAGNVSEWAADWYDPAYYAATDGATDPAGPSQSDATCVSGIGACRVTRGGHFGRAASELRCGDREPELPAETFIDLGFRCASGRALPP